MAKRKTERKFCNNSCRGKFYNRGEKNNWWKGGPKVFFCKTCSKKIGRWVGKREKKRNQKNFFCSKKCEGKFTSLRQIGKNNPVWNGGTSFLPYPFQWNETLKQLIRRRDNYKCQLCGAPQEEFTKALPVHHIDYNKENCNKDNLITLCQSCHRKTNINRNYWKNLFSAKIGLLI